ncbi:TPR_REGION domain-containing protein [Azospirillaceae bacterium]
MGACVSAIFCAIPFALLAGVPAEKRPLPPSASVQTPELAACVKKAETSPKTALSDSETWLDHGGGPSAKLCQATARFYLGRFAEAGQQFEELAPILAGQDSKHAAGLLARAGWAWLLAGDSTRAERVYSTALSRTPDDSDLYIDRAFARMDAKRPREAIEDLSQALKRSPKRAEAYYYRAAAWRAVNELGKALSDVEKALEIRADYVEALFLRGNLKALNNNIPSAIVDWRRVVRLAPDSEEGRKSQQNLTRSKSQ